MIEILAIAAAWALSGIVLYYIARRSWIERFGDADGCPFDYGWAVLLGPFMLGGVIAEIHARLLGL